MPDITADEIITQKHVRNFIQYGGARPGNVVRYSGQDAQYMSIEGVSNPESGGIDPIWVHDLRRPGSYRLVGRSITPADLAEATLVFYEKHGAIPKHLGNIGCPLNTYQLYGKCKDLSDFVNGWTDFVLIYERGLITDKDLGDRSSFDSDDAIEVSLTVVWAAIYPVGSLGFGEVAALQVDREVVDVVYGTQIQCGDCGPENDGTDWIYAITKSSGSGSPGLPAEVEYTVDGGLNWTSLAITGIGATEDPIAIDIVGDKLVVVSRTAGSATLGGYYWATINTATGVPGTWTEVTSGFVDSKQPNDLYVASPREVYFAADGGYIYKATDITSGVSVINAGSTTTNNLQRIDGAQDTVVAVGASATVIISSNRGSTFATSVAAPGAATLQALEVMDHLRFWVGNSSGSVYYTLNGGESWTERAFSGSGSGSVQDIVFATDSVGYIAHATSTPTARIFRTIDGGESWTNTKPHILNFPTFNRANRVAIPTAAAPDIAANNIIAGGLAGNGTDGILVLGIAGRL